MTHMDHYRSSEDTVYPQPEFTLGQLQRELKCWVAKQNFKTRHELHPLLGVMEEVGELSHAVLKSRQGIRGTEQKHRLKMLDAVGDIVIYLADFCTEHGFDFQRAVEETWSQVKKRDWSKDRDSGGTA